MQWDEQERNELTFMDIGNDMIIVLAPGKIIVDTWRSVPDMGQKCWYPAHD